MSDQETYDFYKCQKCGRIVTALEFAAALGVAGTGQACPCGALRFAPINITWREYRQPQVIRYARAQFGADGDRLLRDDLAREAETEGLTSVAIGGHLKDLLAAQAELQ